MSATGYRVECASRSDVGPVRPNNEDACAWYDLQGDHALPSIGAEASTAGKGVLFLVSDGMGGANAGEVASKITLAAMIEYLRAYVPPRPAAQPETSLGLLESAIEKAHQEVLKASVEDDAFSGMGATLTALWLAEDMGWYGQVGDSRLYELASDKIHQISQDQTPVGRLVRAGILSPDEARFHPKRHLLEQALGGGMSHIRPVCERLHPVPGNAYLLCTDGLHDPLGDTLLHAIVSEQAKWDLSDACHRLVHTANSQDGSDNATVILCHIRPLTLP